MILNTPSLEIVLRIYEEEISKDDGLSGLKAGKGPLEAALNRASNRLHYDPGTTFWQFVAVTAVALAKGHCFHDGNKRISFAVTELLLGYHGLEFTAEDGLLIQVWEQIASSAIDEDRLADFIERSTKKAELF